MAYIYYLMVFPPMIDFIRLGRTVLRMTKHRSRHLTVEKSDVFLMKISFFSKLIAGILGLLYIIVISKNFYNIIFYLSILLILNFVLYPQKIRKRVRECCYFIIWLSGLYLPLSFFLFLEVLNALFK